MLKLGFLLFTIIYLFGSSSAGTIQVRNNCNQDIWVANHGGNTGGFMLSRGQERSFELTNGRVWGQTGCSRSGTNCDSLGNMVTLAEMHWDPSGRTWYNLSLVDGYNLQMTIAPFRSGSGSKCHSIHCNFDMNRCPNEFKQIVRGKLTNCKSACTATNDAGYCCRGAPCKIHQYSRTVKQACPQAYSYAKDDHGSVFDCHSGNNGLKVIFC